MVVITVITAVIIVVILVIVFTLMIATILLFIISYKIDNNLITILILHSLHNKVRLARHTR